MVELGIYRQHHLVQIRYDTVNNYRVRRSQGANVNT